MAHNNDDEISASLAIVASFKPADLLLEVNSSTPLCEYGIDDLVKSVENVGDWLRANNDVVDKSQICKELLAICASVLAGNQGKTNPPEVPHWHNEGCIPGVDREVSRQMFKLVSDVSSTLSNGDDSKSKGSLILQMAEVLFNSDDSLDDDMNVCFRWGKITVLQLLVSSMCKNAVYCDDMNPSSVASFRSMMITELREVIIKCSEEKGNRLLWRRAISHAILKMVNDSAIMFDMSPASQDSFDIVVTVLAFTEPKLFDSDNSVVDPLNDGTGRVETAQNDVFNMFPQAAVVKSKVPCAEAIWVDRVAREISLQAFQSIIKVSHLSSSDSVDMIGKFMSDRLNIWLLALRKLEREQRDGRLPGWKTAQGVGNRFMLAQIVKRLPSSGWRRDSEALGNVVPLTLSLLDDFETHNQLVGIDLLLVAVRSATPTTVSLHADLLFDALSKSIPSVRMPDDRPEQHYLGCRLLLLLFKCLIKVLSVLPMDGVNLPYIVQPVAMRHSVMSIALGRIARSRTDAEVLSILSALPPLIRQLSMGLELVKSASLLVETLAHVVQERGGACQAEALVALAWTIPGIWPTLPNHGDLILSTCFRLVLCKGISRDKAVELMALVLTLGGPTLLKSIEIASKSPLLLPICEEALGKRGSWQPIT
jgi:hypothetical protein